jgi:hypothetical protein
MRNTGSVPELGLFQPLFELVLLRDLVDYARELLEAFRGLAHVIVDA